MNTLDKFIDESELRELALETLVEYNWDGESEHFYQSFKDRLDGECLPILNEDEEKEDEKKADRYARINAKSREIAERPENKDMKDHIFYSLLVLKMDGVTGESSWIASQMLSDYNWEDEEEHFYNMFQDKLDPECYPIYEIETEDLDDHFAQEDAVYAKWREIAERPGNDEMKTHIFYSLMVLTAC
jgi:hypothetical protein